MKEKNSIPKDEALRTALLREGERLQMPQGMSARVMAQIKATEPTPFRPRRASASILRWVAVAAVAALAVFMLIMPRIRDARDMARFEGSYVEENGQRVEDYQLIKTDIHEALSMADQAEAFAQ